RPARDPRREVRDPLAIAADLQDRRQPAQVRGDRFVERQDPQAFSLDADLLAVGLDLDALDLGDNLEPSAADRLDALLERVDHGMSNRQEGAPHLLLVPDRMPNGRCRGRSRWFGDVARLARAVHDAPPPRLRRPAARPGTGPSGPANESSRLPGVLLSIPDGP